MVTRRFLRVHAYPCSAADLEKWRGMLELEQFHGKNETDFGEGCSWELCRGVRQRFAATLGEGDGTAREVFESACGDFAEGLESSRPFHAGGERAAYAACARI